MPIYDLTFRRLVPKTVALHQILSISPVWILRSHQSQRVTYLERIDSILLYPLPALSP
jgi:hypothetical protein